MAESARDLSTTSFGLTAAYFLPGAIVLGELAWYRPCLRDFLLRDGKHLTLAVLLAVTISLLLDGLRIAVFSRWLFKEISFTPTAFQGVDNDKVTALMAAVDEVFRLHQFYSALFFLVPFITLDWFIQECGRPLKERFLIIGV